MSAVVHQLVAEQDPLDTGEKQRVKPAANNVILSSVRELTSLQASMEDIRAELRARGIQGQASNVMVEMAFHNRLDEMQVLMDTALRSSEQEYGHGAITRNELQEALDNLLILEKDVAHTRKLCKQQGLNLQVMNMLVQLVRQNPGDGGTTAINTFLGYARACNIELSGIDEVTQKYTTEPASVLPDIQRLEIGESRILRKMLVRDIVIGLTLTVVMFLLVM